MALGTEGGLMSPQYFADPLKIRVKNTNIYISV